MTANPGLEHLPARYQEPWLKPFRDPIFERLEPDCSVLDIGSGRHPAIPVDERPEGVRYVGLDLSLNELSEAGPGAYTEMIAADAATLQPQLEESFDLVISWQVLEHVKDLEATISNIRRYVRPGGRFVAFFSGSWSAFGVMNRLLPDRIGSKIVNRVMNRTEQNRPVFPAYYDHCHSSALEPMLAGWGETQIVPFYAGATYFNFSPLLQRIYLGYENQIVRRQTANLATHYLVIADR